MGASSRTGIVAGRIRRPPERRLAPALEIGTLLALAYIPLLLTKPGIVASDTKQFLYLDPGTFLRQVSSLWDPQFAGGMVTHQYIGYLLPQGAFYWLLASLHVPVWVAQRLWAGSLLFLAGAGVRFAMRILGLDGAGPIVAGIIYELSPYAMQYLERISAILMPWAGLGWMLGFAVLAVRRGGWKHPAQFALVVALVGGINATSVIYACLAPLLWLAYAIVAREARPWRVLAALARIAALSVAVSLWWAIALVVEGTYGLSVLRYTETLPAIAQTSAASEVSRGLGYWYFYGTDRLGPWLASSVEYTQSLVLLVTSFALPVLGFAGALSRRVLARCYLAAVAFVGLLLSVGVHPYLAPSLLGELLKAFMNGTTTGLALRSTDRATPLVILGLAGLAGAGASAIWARRRLAGWVAAALCAALAIGNAAPLMTGLAVDPHFDRASTLPRYFASAASYLDAQGNATRVLVEPGENWADYTWGNTIDSVWPGILSRPSIQRQQLIDGSNQTADLLSAFDLTLQQGTYETSTLAPIARLLSAGDVVLESDERYWHWGTPEPQATWQLVDRSASGVGRPVAFGPRRPNVAPTAFGPLDEEALGVAAEAPQPPALAVFPIEHARPIYRAEPASAPLVLDGSGAGIVAAAGAGLLADNPTIVYAGSLDGYPALAREALAPGAVLVLTDTNRKELRRWSSVAGNIGETLPARPGPGSDDPTSQALPLFASSSASTETLAQYSDARYVAASAYGNPIELTPEDRPYMAFDGAPGTAWLTASLTPARGQWLQVSLDHRVHAGSIRLLQPYPEDGQRWITRATLSFDGGRPTTAELDTASRRSSGQIIRFPARSFSTLRITIDQTRSLEGAVAAGTGVGFAEVDIPGVRLRATLDLPTDLLSRLGTASLGHRLVIVLTRDRVAPYPPRSDPEPFMSRRFVLPTARDFAVAGTARIADTASNEEIDAMIGADRHDGGVRATSVTRLPGDLAARASMALDGDPSTAWTSGFGTAGQLSGSMAIHLAHTVRISHLTLQLVADRRHSVPTWLRISTNLHGPVLVELPPVRDRARAGSIATVRLSFGAMSGRVIHVAVAAVRSETAVDWYNGARRTLPFSIAELGIEGVRLRAPAGTVAIPAICRANLMSIDGRPVWLEVTGTAGAATSGAGLSVRGCGPDRGGLRLGRGPHVIVTAAGARSGFAIDRLVFDSAAGGKPARLLATGLPAPVPGTLSGSGVDALPIPHVRVVHAGATSAELDVTGATRPFWLVLGEGLDAGWTGQIIGGAALGDPSLVDGYANGWYVVPHARSFLVALVWRPQGEVNVGVWLSGLALLVCLGLVVEPVRRVRRRCGRRGPQRSRSAAADVVAGAVDGRAGGTAAAVPAPVGEMRGRLPLRTCFLVAGAASATSLLVTPTLGAIPVAAVIGGLTFLGARIGRERWCLGGAAVLAIAVTGGLTLAVQADDHFPANAAWPTHFDTASIVALSAFVLMASDAAVSILRFRPSTAAPRRLRDEALDGGRESRDSR